MEVLVHPAAFVRSSPTVPKKWTMAVQGLPREIALQFRAAFLTMIQRISHTIDLSTLDGVTIGLDYQAALSSIDRGVSHLPQPAPTDTNEVRGIAMAVDVIRRGQVRTHLVFDAEAIVALVLEEDEVALDDLLRAIGTVAHECAHVQIAADKRRAIPECGIDRPVAGYEHAVLLQIAEPWWDEYAACRLSAPFAPQQTRRHAAAVVAGATVARSHASAAVEEFLIDGNVDRLIDEAGRTLCAPLASAAYLTGGMDGIGSSWDAHREAWQALKAAGLDDFAASMHTELRRLWDTYDYWQPTIETFDGLQQIAKRVFASQSIQFETASDGSCLVEVRGAKPFCRAN